MTLGQEARGDRLAMRLARLGFTELTTAQRLLTHGPLAGQADTAWLLDALSATADPDLALAGFARLLETLPKADAQSLLARLEAESGPRGRLFAVLGVSVALGEHLARHPDDWQALAVDDPTPPTAIGMRAT